jgi:two-component system KDP operon response regulator KdpE
MLALRRKLEADPSRPRYLLTEPGVGYRLVTEHFPEAWKQVELSEPGHEANTGHKTLFPFAKIERDRDFMTATRAALRNCVWPSSVVVFV